MTVPSYTTDLQDVTTADTGTFIEFTGRISGGTPSAEADYYIQGAGCSSAAAYTKAAYYCSIGFDYGGGISIPSGNAVLFWHWFGCPTSLDTLAAGGVRCVVGSAIDAFKEWYVGGNATPPMPYGGWTCYAADPNVAADYTTSPGPSGTFQFFGMSIYLGAGVARGNVHALDAVRYGRGEIRARYGEAANYSTFVGLAAKNDANNGTAGYNRWGLFSYVNGVYLWKGLMSLGYGGIAVDFQDSNRAIYVENTIKVASTFNKIEVNEVGSRVDWTNISIAALGTVSPGSFIMNAAADVNFESCLFTDMGTFTFLSSAEALRCQWLRCGAVTAPGILMTGSKILTPTVAADASALVWNANVDLDSKIDGMTFSKGTLAHHAIQLGASSPAALTIRGVTFSGFNAADAASDSVLLLSDKGTDTVWTIGCVGCTGTVSYKKVRAGDTVNITQGVALTVHVQNADTGADIVGARVLVMAASGGPKPYQVSVGLSRTGSTVTVAHTAHGLATNDWVVIQGATEGDYNGVWQITYVGVDSYSYDIGIKTPSSPATGSPTSTFAPIHGTTNSSGNISDTRTYSGSQPFTGRARKASGSPYYKSAPLSGTIDSATGATVTVQMIEEI